MKAIFSLITVLLFVISLGAQVNQQIGDIGSINWQNQIIRSTGIGAPNPKVPLAAQRAGALEAAKRVALRNLLETVKGMYINSETTVENAMMVSAAMVNSRKLWPAARRSSRARAFRSFSRMSVSYVSVSSWDALLQMPSAPRRCQKAIYLGAPYGTG